MLSIKRGCSWLPLLLWNGQNAFEAQDRFDQIFNIFNAVADMCRNYAKPSAKSELYWASSLFKAVNRRSFKVLKTLSSAVSCRLIMAIISHHFKSGERKVHICSFGSVFYGLNECYVVDSHVKNVKCVYWNLAEAFSYLCVNVWQLYYCCMCVCIWVCLLPKHLTN